MSGRMIFDWNRVLLGVFRHRRHRKLVLIEQEDYPEGKSSMECTKISLDGLKAILNGDESTIA